MEMTMRWYGKKHDTVTLEQIHQICYVKGIITTLYEKLPGEVWTLDEILTMKNEMPVCIWQVLKASTSAMPLKPARLTETEILRII